MTKIHIPNQSKTEIGGGYSFIRNITKYLKTQDFEITCEAEADVIFICGATMTDGKSLQNWKDAGKKILLRVDGIPKDSRNRGCGVSRLKKCADFADRVIYQSEWSRREAKDLLNKDGSVIYNGADTDIFYPSKKSKPSYNYFYLYVGYRKEEDKRFSEACYWFKEAAKKEPECRFTVIGRFNDELIKYGFDFYNHEKVKYLGVIPEPKDLADIMREHQVLLYPSFADPAPQTVVEALNCGMKIELVNPVGGTRELLYQPIEQLSLDYMGSMYEEVIRSL